MSDKIKDKEINELLIAIEEPKVKAEYDNFFGSMTKEEQIEAKIAMRLRIKPRGEMSDKVKAEADEWLSEIDKIFEEEGYEDDKLAA